jgi:hypothetical protein
VREVNRKVLGIVFVLMAVAMLALSVSTAYATKPVTMTLTGTWSVQGLGDSYAVEAGMSGNLIWKFRNVPVLWTGDISGSGIMDASELVTEETAPICFVGAGTHFLEDVTINVPDEFTGTGDLTIGFNKDALQYFIKSGSDDLRSIRGKGTITPVGMIEFDYQFEIQINP